MTYLLDTDTCIYWLKGIQSVNADIPGLQLENWAGA